MAEIVLESKATQPMRQSFSKLICISIQAKYPKKKTIIGLRLFIHKLAFISNNLFKYH